MNIRFLPYLSLLFFVFILASTGSLHAQKSKNPMKQGNDAYKNKDYKAAAGYYEQVYKALKRPKLKDMDFLYKFGYCEMESGNYQDAINVFNQFISISEGSMDVKGRKKVKEWIKYCEPKIVLDNNGETLPGYENIVQIVNLRELNSRYNEYSPFYVNQDSLLLFSSEKQDSKGTNKVGGKGSDIYFSKYKNGKFSISKRLGNNINTSKQEVDPFVTSDGNYLYFSRIKYTDEFSKKAPTSQILRAKKGPEGWGIPVKLNLQINTNNWNANAFVSSDGQYLFFTSDRPGGSGGRDIYYCTWDPGKNDWSDPKNIGKPINTQFDDIEPKYYPDQNVLFFSSRGHKGYGGYDIFYSKHKDDGSWSEPKNFGLPINSTRDEFGFVKQEKTDPIIAYMVSNRDGGRGNYDLYRIVFSSEIPMKEQQVVVADTNIEVTKEMADSALNADTSMMNKTYVNSEGFFYRVQIGAYKKPINVKQVFISINQENIVTELNQKLTKYLMKDKHQTSKAALEQRRELVDLGYKDVWVVPYYNGERLSTEKYKQLQKKLKKISEK